MEESISSLRVISFCSSLVSFALTGLIVTQGLGLGHFFQMVCFHRVQPVTVFKIFYGEVNVRYGLKFSFTATEFSSKK